MPDIVAEKTFSLSDLAYEKLMSAVINGQYSVNSRLPPELELARRIGVSRPVLRAALIRLRTDGILASKRGSGNYVIRQPHQTVLQMVQLSQIVDIQNCFKYRVGIEGETAYYAALSKDKNALHQIEKALLALGHAIYNRVPGVEHDFSFHFNIALATENQYFISSLMAIRAQFSIGTSVTHNLTVHRTKERKQAIHGEHEAIYAAIARGDAVAAREAMRSHIENARRRLFEGNLEQV
jgi:GntR family transcriptional regulator, transcriptional repressor for pyruvate dehydrogenase complex